MGELVSLLTGHGSIDIIVSRSAHKEDLMGLIIDKCKNIDIAAAFYIYSTIRIYSGDINGKSMILIAKLCWCRFLFSQRAVTDVPKFI